MGTSELSNTIKTFDTMYVGFDQRDKDGPPLGFMVPDGADKAAEKRKATVDHWSKGWDNKKPKIAAKTYKNEPIEGFKFVDHIRHPKRNGIDKWRIYDPRGFELEITSRNVLNLIFNGAVMQGTIQGPCAWVRERAQNILVLANSKEYRAAMYHSLL